MYSKNSTMTKTELYQALKAKGIFDTNSSRDDLWYKALKLYQTETGIKGLSLGCSGCMTKVRNWLQS